MAREDIKIFRLKMRKLLHKHYKKQQQKSDAQTNSSKETSECKHCKILYEKHTHLIYVSLGSLDKKSDKSRYSEIGLNVAIYPYSTRQEAFFNLNIPLIAVTLQSQVFSSELSVFMCEASTTKLDAENFTLTPGNGTGRTYPTLHPRAWQTAGLFIKALDLRSEESPGHALYQTLFLV